MAARDIRLRILVGARDQASTVLARLRAGINAVGASALKAAANIAKIGAAIGAAVKAAGAWALGRLLGESAAAAETLQRQMFTLEQLIAQTGRSGQVTAEQLSAVAERLDEATLGNAGQIRESIQALLTFKAIGVDSFERVLTAALDLEASNLGSFESNVIQLGKALQDPVAGLTALTRAGVSFGQEQIDVIKRLTETGEAAKAQGLILAEIEGQVGGAAAAAGKGLSGLKDLTDKLMTDIREAIGAGLLAPLERAQKRVNDLYTQLRDSGALERFGVAVGNAFDAATQAVVRWVSSFDFNSLLIQFNRFRESAARAIGDIGTRMDQLSDGARRLYASMQAVLSGLSALWNGFKGTVELVATVVVSVLAGIASAAATVVETLAKIGIQSEASAIRARLNADALADAAARFGKATTESYRKAGAAAEDFGAAMSRATTTQKTAISGLTDAERLALEVSTGLTEQERMLAEQWAETATAADAAAKATRDLADAKRQAADDTTAATDAAFKELGLQSTKDLKDAEDRARVAYETILKAGTETPERIAAAHQVWLTRAAEAGDAAAGRMVEQMKRVATEGKRAFGSAGLSGALREPEQVAQSVTDRIIALADALAAFRAGAISAQQLADAQSQVGASNPQAIRRGLPVTVAGYTDWGNPRPDGQRAGQVTDRGDMVTDLSGRRERDRMQSAFRGGAPIEVPVSFVSSDDDALGLASAARGTRR